MFPNPILPTLTRETMNMQANSQQPRVCVIMRTKNSDWVIDRALSALFSQTFTDFELTVVDSGSTDRTLDIVRRYPCRLIEIEAADYYPGAVLNSAIEQTTGDIVVFQNSDTVPLTQHALSHLVAAFDAPDVQAAFGRQIPRPEAVDWVRKDYDSSFPANEPAPPWLTLSLPFAAMRRTAWECHSFYEDAWASEDTEWGHWAKQNGVVIRYVPEALVMHSHNYSLRQIYGRRFVEGEADSFIYHGGDSSLRMLRRTLSSSAGDLKYQLARGKFGDLFNVPLRRLVYQWAYFRGRNFGNRRALKNDTDRKTGQKAVLSRYE
ncbi:MAG: glycosyltransferase family A protein [Mariniblastus sp.]|nr:glycosyltransferase family A protein [Mariniblastus sp.]